MDAQLAEEVIGHYGQLIKDNRVENIKFMIKPGITFEREFGDYSNPEMSLTIMNDSK